MIRYLAVLNPLYATLFWAIVLTIGTLRINRAKFMLGMFMMVAFFLYLGHAFYFTRNFQIFTWYEWIYTLTSLAVFPMYYHYVRLLTVETRLKPSDLLHYLPGVIVAVASLFLIIFMGPINRLAYIHHLEHGSHSFYLSGNPWIDAYQMLFLLSRLVFGIQIFAYLILNIRLIRHHKENIAQYYSNPEELNLNWAQLMYIFLLLTSLAGFIFNALGRSTFLDNSVKLLIPSFIFSVLLFVIGYLGNRQDQIVSQIVKLDEMYPQEERPEKEPNDVVVKLEEYFTSEKAYLNKDLKIWEVSKMINSNRTYVSGIINKHYRMNFCTYVNHHRVKEARRMLETESFDGYTLEHIGDLSGFGSLNSFIRAFQKETGITPGKYREDRKVRKSDQSFAHINT
ncbi:AraC family transcriptional regulator [Prolixibacter sp. NT017]|uniref:AraC family transcriptional regulator n=1 Tax=Prolixibacter sp. NT017 TaxID=2652390 RepID=UPI001285569F|nr:AraC family transcriptional regulator [Prolixibacter sp. NT017]GET24294.1 hypothetical protein NT017_06230 [Prolixibacter sp. NT017]